VKKKNPKKEKNQEIHKPKPVQKPDVFENKIEKYSFYIAIGIVLFAGFIVFRNFLLLRNVYFFKDIASDSINIHQAVIMAYARYFRDFGMGGWCFSLGMGQNILGSMAGYSDISFFCAAFINENYLAYIGNYTEFLKLILIAVFMYLYLKSINISAFASFIGCLVYALSGFFILGGNWLFYSSQSLFLAMLLFSLENVYKNKMLWLLPLVIFQIAVFQIFSLYLFAFFIAIYTIFRFLLIHEDFQIKKLIFIFGRIFILSTIGVLLSGFFSSQTLYELINGPRVSGESGLFKTLSSAPLFALENDITRSASNYGVPFSHLKTIILRFFSNDILGSGVDYRGWTNYMEAPMTYIGLVTLLLIPQVFQFLSKKQKIIYAVFIAFWLLLYIFPFFRYTFWLFTGDYFRTLALFVSFALLFCAINAFSLMDKRNKINIILLLVTLAILLVLLYYPYFPKQYKIVNKNIQYLATVFLLTYSVLLYLFKTKFRRIARVILLVAVFIEIVVAANTSLNERYYVNPRTKVRENAAVKSAELSEKKGYNDYTVEALDFIKNRDKSFFRANKDYFSGMAYHAFSDDALAQDYYGSRSYQGFNQKYYIKFLSGMNVIDPRNETETRWAPGITNRLMFQTLASTKYQLMKKNAGSLPFVKMTYDSLAQFGDTKVFRNKYALPFGFCFNNYIKQGDFSAISAANKELNALRAVVMDEKDCPDYARITAALKPVILKDTLAGTAYTWDTYYADVRSLQQDTLVMTSFSQNVIKGTIETDSSRLLFFSIPYDEGWKATVDGKHADINIVDFGLMGLFLEKGKHSIELSYSPPWLKQGRMVSMAGLVFYLMLIGLIFWRKSRKKATE